MAALAPSVRTLVEHQALAGRYLAELRRCTESHFELTAGVIATVDGIELASISHQSRYRPAQLAAMASSLLAVAAAASREVDQSACERLIVESGASKLLIKPVGGGSALLLCLALPSQVLLGKALWAAEEITRSLRSI
ncbi:roadblock/LC7 domain-containing protein [Xenophilus sp. Marseille-Q4582]|uniref:roadblock/LC7 domain-containing protein n=1 Tax=Xenophilus sp. Marseille-Q4582 TaxID=2866600 RepID=UPI001CE46660|nr:roadblock/LC7 domain-containing protein [Xenophilus sp. Marseille-Q4582]